MSYNSGMPITFTIPLNIPDIEVMFWMREFTTDTLNKRYRVNYPSASLYIQKTVSYSDFKAMDPTSKTLLSFDITPYILDDVKDMFKEALSWFSDENKALLYGTNDDGLLLFNSDYRNLNALCVNEYGKMKTALKIIPTVIEVGNNVMSPGAIFHINTSTNAIILQEYQLKRLGKFILDFNFIPYIQFAMQCFQHSVITGTLLTREQVEERLNYQKQYDTNFRY